MAAPLPERLRPQVMSEFVGQVELIGPGTPLRTAYERGRPYSTILFGPPGSGKTTLARLLAQAASAEFVALSALQSGVRELKGLEEQGREVAARGGRLVAFIDEIHRYTHTQQDALLRPLEEGTIILIGATTENPAFALTSALLSRVRLHVLKPLAAAELSLLIERALSAPEGMGGALSCRDAARAFIAEWADGDGRKALALLELAAELAAEAGGTEITADHVAAAGGDRYRRFDKGGDLFYDQISALHKSVRGSDPDAALYWLVRLLDGGCDPRYVARRLVRAASEDIGNADPRALGLALDAWEAWERLGSPEGDLMLAQTAVYLASVPKSNAVYKALQAAQADVRKGGTASVPAHLRNAPTAFARSLGHGRHYRYPHDEDEGYAADVRYFPDDMESRSYYVPTDRGLELRIGERLTRLRARNRRKD
ncbi:MAG: replication-associated recombination protein A [Gammaproteobacteria bacterium]|nr:replication-associated recombination protein A [Gammaproteobacteria bacterium]